MAKHKETERELALLLYVEKGQSQKSIAEQLGVLPKTVGNWVKEGEWNKIRAAHIGTPTMTVANLLNAINGIVEQATEEGRPINAKEADTIAKLTASFKNIKRDLNIAIYMEVFTEFLTWLSTIDLVAAKSFGNYQKQFITEKSKQIQ